MKTLKLLFALAFAVTLSLSTTACGGDDGPGTEKGGGNGGDNGGGNGGDNGGGNGGGENGGGNENMTESEKKEFVDKTAQKLVAQINAEDFRKITDLAQYVSNNLTRGVSSSSPTRVIEDFFEAAFNSCTLTNTDTYIKRLFVMSYFSAEFNYRNGAWEKSSTTPTNTLRFNFPDKNGQSCVAEVVGSGTETEVHASIFDDTKWRYENYYPYNRYQVTTENRIKVPQKINVKLTQGNSALASINVTINVSSGEFKYNSSALETSLNADIVGYKINLSKAFYNGGNNAGVDLTVSKGNTMLVKANASTNIRLNESGKFVSAGNANVNIDVMGEVQAKGTLDDFNKIDELMKRADNAKYEETTYKNTVDQINKQFNIGIYFNGNNTRQAYIQYYPFLSKKYYDEYWKAEPVIYFDDGTSYSTLKEFGNDTRFSELIQKVKDLITDFKSLVQ